MSKARRVSEELGRRSGGCRGWATPHTHEGTGEPMEGLEVPEGQEGTFSNEPLAKRFCKRCEASAEGTTVMRHDDGSVYGFSSPLSVTVAPTGTAHLDAGKGLTLCGLEHADW